MRAFFHFAALVAASGALVAFGGRRHSVPNPIDVSTPEPVESDPRADATDDARGTEAKDVDRLADAEEADEADDGSDDSDAERDEGNYDDAAPLLEGPDAGKRLPRGGCPSTMVRAGNFCIDRYEAPNRRGARPFVMQSANDANAWCTDHRKRLCSEDEWIAACQGEDHRTYPYGNEHVDGRCNDDQAWQKVDEGLLAKWPAPEAKAHAKELYQATPSGAKRKCVSEVGARDMTGNVEEWVLRTREHANVTPYILIGCYWSGCYGGNKPTCHSTNSAHGPAFRFYETGFRCCKDAAGKR